MWLDKVFGGCLKKRHVISATFGRSVFQFYDKLTFLDMQIYDIMCVIHDTIQTGWKKKNLSLTANPRTYYFS